MQTMETRKITVELPTNLVSIAQDATGKNLKETISLGLKKLAQDQAYDKLLALHGTYESSISLDELREDR